jgi:hypothetical protein
VVDFFDDLSISVVAVTRRCIMLTLLENRVNSLVGGKNKGCLLYARSDGCAVNRLYQGECTNFKTSPASGLSFFRLHAFRRNGDLYRRSQAGHPLHAAGGRVQPVGFAGSPKEGFTTFLGGLILSDWELVHKFNADTQGYQIFTFDLGAWTPAESSLAVGEGYWVRKSAAGSWNRTFSVNP